MQTQLKKIGTNTTCPIAIIIRDGSILMGHRHYTKTLSVWTCPGGRCDPEEIVEQALRREVKEEVGITDLKIEEYLGEVVGAKEGDRVPVFVCSSSQDFTLMEPEKFSEWKWVSFYEYRKKDFSPQVKKLVVDYISRL
ncbi:hypothetical protein COB55_02000 [Candidatus Wolfebacteria bacterium]|nr:MAG: hypothetical protein COB55_02000 [Candidatus Wolfebacteria bacterium]